MLRRFQCISALIAEITYVRITFTLAVTAGMSALTLDRPHPPGEEAGHPAKVEVEVVVMDLLHLHRQDLGTRWRPRSRLAVQVVGSNRGYPGRASGFYGTAADSHGAENNQCGSSFYGPAFGGGVLLQVTLQVH